MRTRVMTGYVLTTVMAGALTIGCAHAAKPAKAGADPYAKQGFYTKADDGRLWVFREGSDEHKAYLEKGKPAKHIVRPGVGPDGMTVRAVDSETIVEYVTTKAGFFTQVDKDGRLWVFVDGSDAHKEFVAKGKPAKHVVRPAAGPMGLTLKAVDAEVIDAYLAAK